MVLLARGILGFIAALTLVAALPGQAAAQGGGTVTVADPAAQLDPTVAGPLRDALCAIPGLLLCPVVAVAEEAAEAAGEVVGDIAAELIEGPIAALDSAAAEYTNQQILRVINLWTSLGDPINVEVANEIVVSTNVVAGFIAVIQLMLFAAVLVWSSRRAEAAKEFGFGTLRWFVVSSAGVLFLTQLVALADAGAVIALSDAVTGEGGIINTEETPGWALFLLPFVWPIAWFAEQVFFIRMVLLTVIGGFWPLIAALAMRNRQDALFRAVTGLLVSLALFPAVFATAGWVFVQIATAGASEEAAGAAPEFVSTMLTFIAIKVVVLIIMGKAAWAYSNSQVSRAFA